MNQTIEAIFEKGVLKPINPDLLNLNDGEKVTVFIQKIETSEMEPSLQERYFKGLSEDDIEDVITHALEDPE